MGDDVERWWTWYVSGYRGRKLVCAKAIDGKHAQYIADLFKRDGVQKITVHNHGEQEHG